MFKPEYSGQGGVDYAVGSSSVPTMRNRPRENGRRNNLPPRTPEEVFAICYTRLREYLGTHLGLQDDRDLDLFATYIVATWFVHVFEHAPRINFTGRKGSGKSTALKIGSFFSFRGIRYTSPTAPALFHHLAEGPASFYIEEQESSGLNRDADLRTFLRSGYERGIDVGRVACPYPTFGFVAFSSISRCSDQALLDRTITVRTKRTADLPRVYLKRLEVHRQTWHAVMRLTSLALSDAVERIYQDEKSWRAFQCRDGDLWRPLLAVATLLELVGVASGLVGALQELAAERQRERVADEVESTEGQVLLLTARYVSVAENFVEHEWLIGERLTSFINEHRTDGGATLYPHRVAHILGNYEVLIDRQRKRLRIEDEKIQATCWRISEQAMNEVLRELEIPPIEQANTGDSEATSVEDDDGGNGKTMGHTAPFVGAEA